MPSPLTYQRALGGLRIYGNLYVPEVTRLLDELVTREKTLGENHPDVADTLESLVQHCHSMGKHKEAESFGKRALEILEAVHGKCHVEVAEQLIDLAFSCWKQGKYEETERYYQRIISIYETKLAPDDLKIAEAKHLLGSCYYKQGKYKEAKKLYELALEMYELKHGPDHFSVTGTKSELDSCKEKIEADKLKRRKKNIAQKRTSGAVDADGKSTNSHRGPVAAKTAKIDNTVGTSATSSAALAVVSTLMPASSSDEVVSKESLSLMERVVADARVKIMAEIDGITEMNKHSHLNLKQIIEELQAENFDQNEKLCRANRKIEDLMCSQSTYEQLIAELQVEVDGKAHLLSSSKDRIENLECSRQATLKKSARLEAEISDQAQRLSEAKASIENLQSTSERTIAELEAEIAEKSRQLAEAKRTIESRLFCSICVEKDANRMWTECRHVAACEQCATELLRRDMGNSGNGVACPKCRTPGFPTKVYI